MYNFDYIPLDQEAIKCEVEASQKRRNEAREILTDAIKDAGGNFDIIVFHAVNFGKFKRIIKALEELRLFWCDVDRDIYVNRHEFYDIIYDRSGN